MRLTGRLAEGRKQCRPREAASLRATSVCVCACVCVCVRVCVCMCSVAQSCLTLHDAMDCNPPGSSVYGILQARILEWVAMPSSRGSSQQQGSKPGLLHCRWILYCLSHQGSPRTLDWVACPFCSGPSPPRNQTRISCIAGQFFTN